MLSRPIARLFTQVFQAGADELVATSFDSTIAEGTAIKSPVRLKTVLDAIRRSNGGTAAILEDDILAAMKNLARQGIYVEPTSATAAAAYQSLLDDGSIRASDTTVVVLTGSGLKVTAFMTEIFAGPD